MALSDGARTMLVALWRAIESAGFEPSANGVIACARRHKLRFTDADAHRLLSAFSPRRRHGGAVRAPQNEHERTDEPVRATAPPRLRARNKVLPVTKLPTETNVSAEVSKTAWVGPEFPDSLPSSFPIEVSALAEVSHAFMASFANVSKPESRAKHESHYIGTLAAFRSRGATVSQAWDCFCDAREAAAGKPLFGAMAKTALNFHIRKSPAVNGNGAPERELQVLNAGWTGGKIK